MNGPELDESDMDIHSNVEDGNDEGVENNDGEKNEGEQEKEHVAAEPEQYNYTFNFSLPLKLKSGILKSAIYSYQWDFA